MQQRGMSYSEILELPVQLYNDFIFFCAHIEPMGGYMQNLNTGLIMQTIAAQYCKKLPKLHDLHPYLNKSTSATVASSDVSNFTEIGPDGKTRFKASFFK